MVEDRVEGRSPPKESPLNGLSLGSLGCGPIPWNRSSTQVALLNYLIMMTLGDWVVPLDPLHPDASTPPDRAVPYEAVPNIR